MVEAIERLFFIVLYGGVALWLANDVWRNLQSGSFPAGGWWRWNLRTTRAREPLNYWSAIVTKVVGVIAAAIMAAAYLYVSAIT